MDRIKRALLGFTLVEMIITMVLLSIFTGGLGPYILRTVQSANYEYYMTTVLSQGRSVVMRMSNDIRNINAITTQSPNLLTFTDANGSSVTYSLSGNNLLRNSAILANNATSLAFIYYTFSGDVSSSTANTCYVRFSFTLKQSTWSHDFNDIMWVRNARCA